MGHDGPVAGESTRLEHLLDGSDAVGRVRGYGDHWRASAKDPREACLSLDGSRGQHGDGRHIRPNRNPFFGRRVHEVVAEDFDRIGCVSRAGTQHRLGMQAVLSGEDVEEGTSQQVGLCSAPRFVWCRLGAWHIESPR